MDDLCQLEAGGLTREETRQAGMPNCVLVLEDNAIILLDLEDMLKSMGVELVIAASDASDALTALQSQEPDIALLDVDLGCENCIAVADHLADKGIPFVFVTGFGDGLPLPERHAHVPKLFKPHSQEALLKALTRR